ncbi:MAG: hypothetical protein LWX83_09955 [Anaerolineae bacterium]|nr:hypothetical protein [Anaerolineae bacterium]
MEKTKNKTVFISADHGLAVVYFLQSDVVKTLLEAGVQVVVLTDDGLIEQLNKRFSQPGLIIEGLRLKQARRYFNEVDPTRQYWLNFLRAEGASNRINTEALRCHIAQVDFEAAGKRRWLMPVMKLMINWMRRSKAARQWVYRQQLKYIPNLYADLFDKYQPDLVVSSTPGWRFDRYLLREAAQRGINTAAVIVGWDNPSSYSLPGAPMNWVSCWSELQKQELVDGDDWSPERVHVGGIPSYDGYFRREWLMSKEEYFKLHHLDPQRKLIGYACSFITFSPNYQNIEALAHLVANDQLAEPSQLLIRLHPNHFLSEPLFAGEREKVFQLARELPHVHVVEPVPLGGELGYYSGEDMPEKTSMMAYSDVFSTVYSTMVVEAAIHDRPIVSACIDAVGGWNKPGRFSLALSEIGEWPTHKRFREAGAGRVAYTNEQLREAINLYLTDPNADREARQAFIRNECTYTDASAGKHTGEFLLSIIDRK